MTHSGNGHTAGTVTEVRVHGVSGTPPEKLLGLPVELIARASGDDASGFYRPRIELPQSETAADCDDDAVRHQAHRPRNGFEVSARRWQRLVLAYSWGGLTSGRASRALWLLFLPFLLVNLTHWMLPPAAEHRRPVAATAVALLRLIGLSLTLTLMFAAATATMDIAGWQCAALPDCGRGLGPASFLTGDSVGVRLALSALPVVVLALALWRLGREQPRKIPAVPGTDRSTVRPDSAVVADQTPLAEDRFWEPDPSMDRLRACHITAWASALGALALITPVRYGDGDVAKQISLIALILNGVILGAAVLVTAWNPATGRGGHSADQLDTPLNLLRWSGLAVLAASLVWVANVPIVEITVPSHLPGLHGALGALIGTQAGLLLALFAAVAIAKNRDVGADSEFKPSLRGYTAAFVATMACIVGIGFTVGVGLLAARYLGYPVPTTDLAREADTGGAAAGEDAPLIVPPTFFYTACAVMLLLGVVVVTVAYTVWWRVPRQTKRDLHNGIVDHIGASGEQVKKVARTRVWASQTDSAPEFLAALVTLAVLAGVTVVVFLLKFDLAQWVRSGRSAGNASGEAGRTATFIGWSVMLTAGLVVALAATAFQAFRDRQLRRLVGVLWDVVTFWPKANHPLTPPSYGQVAVPELTQRIANEAAGEDHRAVVVAHSQGTIIAAAAFLQLIGPAGPVSPKPLSLLTFGSPLRRLYLQNFPAYLGFAALCKLREQYPRQWINLWALTDPIGSWVFDKPNDRLQAALDKVDWRLADVTTLTANSDGTYPDICGHSGFWHRCELQHAFVELLPAGSAPPGPMALPSRELAN
jgi:hypothetical protein